MTPMLERFRNYCGLIKVARSGFPWEKTTKGDVALGQCWGIDAPA
jgi:hypothetical protein